MVASNRYPGSGVAGSGEPGAADGSWPFGQQHRARMTVQVLGLQQVRLHMAPQESRSAAGATSADTPAAFQARTERKTTIRLWRTPEARIGPEKAESRWPTSLFPEGTSGV